MITMAQLSKGTPVLVHVVTQHVQDGELSKFDENFNGQFFQMGTSIYLRYKEKLADQKPALVTIKVAAPDEVQLTRKNDDLNLHLYFFAGKQVNARYVTQYGVVPVTTQTTKLNVVVGDTFDGLVGKINIDYLLYSGSQQLGDYKIRLQFKG